MEAIMVIKRKYRIILVLPRAVSPVLISVSGPLEHVLPAGEHFGHEFVARHGEQETPGIVVPGSLGFDGGSLTQGIADGKPCSGSARRVLQNHRRRLLPDHDRWGVGVAGRQGGHDRGIRDPQPFDSMHA